MINVLKLLDIPFVTEDIFCIFFLKLNFMPHKIVLLINFNIINISYGFL